MSSRGWKISLLVLTALALSACGNKKKHKPTSPYQGIWIEQSALHEYSRARAAGGFNCTAILAMRKPFIVQPTGEVYSYLPDAQMSTVDSREYYLGVINQASIFAPIDGQRLAAGGYYAGDMESVGLQPNTRLIPDNGALLATSRYGLTSTFVPVSPDQARRIWVASVRCRGGAVAAGGVAYGPGPGPGPGAVVGVPGQFADQGFQPQYGPGPQGQQGQRQLRQDDK